MSFHSSLRTGAAFGLTVSLALSVVGATSAAAQSMESVPLRLVATAPQLGPVGYRDPLGIMSPDGEWLAYTSGGSLRLTHAAGGTVRALARFAAIRSIAWRPDGRSVAVLATDSTGATQWLLVDARDGTTRPAWTTSFPAAVGASGSVTADPRFFASVAWSSDGAKLAGITFSQNGSTLWTGNADGTNARVVTTPNRLSFPAWTPDGRTLACLSLSRGRQQISMPCGGAGPSPTRLEAYGPIAFSPDGAALYFASPNSRGTLDLYAQAVSGGAPRRITSFARDTYAPSVAKDGRVLFGTQDYRTFIAVIAANGGRARQLTAFQSETPSWSRDDRAIGFTYGTWRRVVDDIHYPNIAQDLGLVRADVDRPAASPSSIVRASPSEDQGLDWSPDGRWIVLHSHADGLDDVWLQPADGSAPAHSITSGGYETGWPRWSPDGRWIAYSTEIREAYRTHGVVFVVGVNATTGEVTRAAQRIPLNGVAGDIDAVEWVTSDSLVVLASEGLDRKAIHLVSRDGGAARVVHRFTSEQQFSGLGVATAGRWVAFIAPASDGHFQVFRVPLANGAPTQVTTDPTDKTQPSVSHHGSSIAFTVFSYQMQFWLLDPP
jgi:Tol biopolymer transport system component